MVINVDAANAVSSRAPEGIDVEVVNKSLPKVKEQSKCLCKVGKFWHWRLASCIEQGPWGYECGFFPLEHHHRVCQDNLKCDPLKTSNSTGGYHPHGDSHKARSLPATCVRCQPEDHCLTGKKRQDEECLKQYEIEGKEACVTLKVTTYHSAVAEATASYTATASAKDTASATAKASATKTESASAKATAEAAHSAVVTVSEKALASATASATASADSKSSATATKTATAEEKASASATATDSHTATSKQTVKKTHSAEQAGIKVTAEDEATAKASATESATATAGSTKTAKATSTATKSADASAKATETAKVTSE